MPTHCFSHTHTHNIECFIQHLYAAHLSSLSFYHWCQYIWTPIYVASQVATLLCPCKLCTPFLEVKVVFLVHWSFKFIRLATTLHSIPFSTRVLLVVLLAWSTSHLHQLFQKVQLWQAQGVSMWRSFCWQSGCPNCCNICLLSCKS